LIYTETRVINRTIKDLRNKVPYIIHQGGTNSGKTFGILYALLSHILYDNKNKKLKVDIVAETIPALKKGCLADFQTILDLVSLSIDYNATDKVYTLQNGTKIHFFAVDKEGKAKHAKRDILFVNECNHVKHSIFKQLAMRTNNSIIMDYNPSSQFWFHSTLLPTLQPFEYTFTRTTYKDNPAVPDKIKRELENETDEYYKRVYSEGKLGQLKGLIYPNFTLIDEMPKDAKKHGYGLDFGFTNDPSSLIEGCIYNNEIYINELIYDRGLLNSDIVKYCNALKVSKSKVIWCDSAEPKSIREIANKGFNSRPVRKGKDSVLFGIQTVKQYKLNITKSSTNLIKELRKYKWIEKDGKVLNTPIDKDNHALDAVRYWAFMNLTQRKIKLKSSSY